MQKSIQIVLSLLHDCLHKGYSVTLDNYQTSPELADALVSYDTNFYGTLRIKKKFTKSALGMET